jgi:hypothetical protein
MSLPKLTGMPSFGGLAIGATPSWTCWGPRRSPFYPQLTKVGLGYRRQDANSASSLGLLEALLGSIAGYTDFLRGNYFVFAFENPITWDPG